MMQLFKEVVSPKNADAKNAEKQEAGSVTDHSEAPASAPDAEPKKGKHGDPGVCCGGCS